MPTGGKDTALVFGPQPPMSVDLTIFMGQMDTLEEHSMIGIGDTVIHANVSDKFQQITNTTLVPRKFMRPLEELKEFYHTVPIGEARFKDKQDVQDFIEEMLQVKLPPFSHKGTCRDYIWKVLKELKVRGNIIDPWVLRKYRKIYNESLKLALGVKIRYISKPMLWQESADWYLSQGEWDSVEVIDNTAPIGEGQHWSYG
ncbi:hypothetical protein F5051DRAFT_447327 [Lentinula edodes]|nr:hypothetical protein F5051DRAFT_447327 [Lentinula edodes]